MICGRESEQVPVTLRPSQTEIRTRLAAARVAAGLTQKEMAWAVGIPIANYIRLERGKHKNPPLGWLVNATKVLDVRLDDLIDDQMQEWYRFDRSKPPPPGWLERPEVRQRAERWRKYEDEGR